MRLPVLSPKSVMLMVAMCLCQPSVLAKEELTDPGMRQNIENMAELIAAAIYELDYLDPDLAPALIEETILKTLESTNLDKKSHVYLQELLDTWFSTLPNINLAIGTALGELSAQQSWMAKDVSESHTETFLTEQIETTEIPTISSPGIILRGPYNKRTSTHLSWPPLSTFPINSDY